MVIVIADAASSVSVTVGYNEQKVSEGTASVAYCSNIEDKSDSMKTFQQYENASVRTEKLSFHASINPAPGEKLDKDKMIEFVKEYMEGMGYGDQPYILYKHNDIDREHYHIVSVRVNIAEVHTAGTVQVGLGEAPDDGVVIDIFRAISPTESSGYGAGLNHTKGSSGTRESVAIVGCTDERIDVLGVICL